MYKRQVMYGRFENSKMRWASDRLPRRLKRVFMTTDSSNSDIVDRVVVEYLDEWHLVMRNCLAAFGVSSHFLVSSIGRRV